MYYFSNDLINLIKKYEGFSAIPYFCAAGVKTIGYGHVIKTNENFEIITEQEATEILIKDLELTRNSVIRNIRILLNEQQFAALMSFTFNLGGGALQRSTLRQKINRGEIFEASKEFTKWIYANGKILPGLIKRRKEEANLFLHNSDIVIY